MFTTLFLKKIVLVKATSHSLELVYTLKPAKNIAKKQLLLKKLTIYLATVVICFCLGFLVSGLVHGGVIVPEETQERLLSLLPGLAFNMAHDQVYGIMTS